jgi:arylsulfatase A-like enzyme
MKLRLVQAILLPATLAALPATVASAERPNILLITADDLGCQVSCYGEKRFQTPRLDALAGQGARFDNYFDPHGPYAPDVNQVSGLPEQPVLAAEIADSFSLKAPTDVAKKRLTATIINTILRVDTGVGLLLDELQHAGLADHTLVVFLGDNGLPVIRGKTWSYEPGVRVPLLMRGPGIAPGEVRRDLAAEVDLLPTILRAAGVTVPAEVAGQALWPASPREFLFTEMDFHEPQILRVQRSVRDARYKLLLNLTADEHQPPVELFDLQADPGETTNLAGDPAYAATRQRLAAALQDWRERTGDPLLDAARVQRWRDAATHWGKLPRVKAGANDVVRIPDGDLDLLK